MQFNNISMEENYTQTFRDMYTRAKEDQTEVVVEYMQEVMNEPHKWKDQETGLTRIDVPMLRLKMDTMKWQAAKLKPKKVRRQ